MKDIDPKRMMQAALSLVGLSCLGFLLLELNLVSYGLTLFCVMPVVIGYILAHSPGLKITVKFGALLGVLIFFYLLYIDGLESLFCIITLSPLLLTLLFVGMHIGYAIRKA